MPLKLFGLAALFVLLYFSTSQVAFSENGPSISIESPGVGNVNEEVSPVTTSTVDQGVDAVDEANVEKTPKGQLVKEGNVEKVQERLEGWKEKHAEVKNRIMDRIRVHGGTMLKRYLTATSRYNKILSRIEAKILEEKALGKDTASIEAALQDIKSEISEIDASLSTTEALINSITPNSDENAVRSVVMQVREVLKAEKQNLIVLHQSIRALVKDLKTLVSEGGPNGTTGSANSSE